MKYTLYFLKFGFVRKLIVLTFQLNKKSIAFIGELDGNEELREAILHDPDKQFFFTRDKIMRDLIGFLLFKQRWSTTEKNSSGVV